MLDRDGYRPNVGILLLNARNDVFWGKRVNQHAWQFPQGGIKHGETPERAMLRELVDRPVLRDCRYLETTVSPSNEPSRRLFHRLARERGAAITERVLFSEADFGPEPHEQETLIRIGPFAGKQSITTTTRSITE